MRTSGILTIGGGAVAAVGALLSLVMLKAFLTDKGQGFADLTGLLFFGSLFAVGASVFFGGRRRARLEAEESERGFAELVVALAKKSGGQTKLEAVCRASELTSDEAQAKMRKLTGLGLFELDFDAGGQAVYKVAAGADSALPAGR